MASAYLDILEVDIGVLAEVDDGSQEVEETLVALEGLKDVDEGSGGQLLVVLGGHLDADLQVLADVGGHHGLDTLQGVLHGQGAKVVHQPLNNTHKNTPI